MRQVWNSPYQTEAFSTGLRAAGIPVEVLELPDGKVFFEGDDDAYTAWELDSSITVDPHRIAGHTSYQLCSSETTATDTDTYYTLALDADSARFSNRFMRNVKKARTVFPEAQLVLAETKPQIETALDDFAEHADRRDDIKMPDFNRRISSLMAAGALLMYTLTDGGRQSLGTACVLKSPTQANMRYYTAIREGNAGHLLHFLAIENLFSEQSMEVVDLSGISPDNNDPKLKGIDEFKRQIGGSIVKFQRTE